MADNKCEVCNERPPIGVACIPGLPMSVAYCQECVQVNASPYWALVSQTAMLNGMENAAPWWHEQVEISLNHLGKTRAQFDADVAVEIVRQKEDEDLYFAEQEAKGREKFRQWAVEKHNIQVFSRNEGGKYIVPRVQSLWEEFLMEDDLDFLGDF
jgi:hypothetical protein